MFALLDAARFLLIAAGIEAVGSGHATAATLRILARGLPASLEISAVVGGAALGSTQFGGTGAGTLFSVNSTGKVTLLHKFTSAIDGAQPNEMLAVDPYGAIYGTTQGGGRYGAGTVFVFTADHRLRVLHAFDPKAGDGARPLQGVVLSSTGAIYGAASGGALDSNGGVFQVSPDGRYSLRYEFRSGGDGHCPYSGVAVDSRDNVYGTVVGAGYGGEPNGAVWRLSPTNKLTSLYRFKDRADGEYPDQSPVMDRAGNLYGTIITRNNEGYAGAVWKIDTAGAFTLLHHFTGKADGFGPNGPLMMNVDGNLYGTTASGGGTAAKPGHGTLFRIAPTGEFAVVHTFTAIEGGYPTGTLAHDRTGAIYGAITNRNAKAGGRVYKVQL